jgi:hypothetical protein
VGRTTSVLKEAIINHNKEAKEMRLNNQPAKTKCMEVIKCKKVTKFSNV